MWGGNLEAVTEVAALHPPGPWRVSPREQTMQYFQQEALVLEAKVSNSESAPRSQPTHIVPGNLAIAPRAFLLCLPELARRGLPILARVPLGIGRTDIANDGRADKTTLVSVRRPPMGSRDVRHPGMRLEILTDRNSSADAGSLWSDRGSPM
jgi:hypothetical protein